MGILWPIFFGNSNPVSVLLGECLPVDLRHSFPDHEVHTSEWAGLKGKQNGELLRAAETAGYQVMITVDRGVPHQRPKESRLAIILLRSQTNQLEDLWPLVDRTAATLMTIHPGETIIVSADA